MIKSLSFTIVAFVALCGGSVARALPEYPEYVQDAVGSPCMPHCNLCHRDDNAGYGTVDRPFGKTVEHVGGLRGGGLASVVSAIDTLRAQAADSDGDGVSDVDELVRGQDPNYGGEGDLCGPQVGCSARRDRAVRGAGGGDLALGLMVLGMFGRGLARRTRRAQRGGQTENSVK